MDSLNFDVISFLSEFALPSIAEFRVANIFENVLKVYVGLRICYIPVHFMSIFQYIFF